MLGQQWLGAAGRRHQGGQRVPVDVKDLPGATTAISAGHTTPAPAGEAGRSGAGAYNDHGQLGDGTTTTSLVPVMVMRLGDALAVSADDDHTCVRTPAPRGVECWGSNLEGQLGDGTRTDSLTRVGVEGLGSGATAISAGSHYTCALINSGRVKCWGRTATASWATARPRTGAGPGRRKGPGLTPGERGLACSGGSGPDRGWR